MGYPALQKWRSAYYDDAERLPRLVLLALQAVQLYVKTKYSSSLFYHAVPLICYQKTSLFLLQRCCKGRTERSAVMPSQQASQQSCGRHNLTWIMNNNKILFKRASQASLEVDLINAHRICFGCAFMWTQQICTFNAHQGAHMLKWCITWNSSQQPAQQLTTRLFQQLSNPRLCIVF